MLNTNLRRRVLEILNRVKRMHDCYLRIRFSVSVIAIVLGLTHFVGFGNSVRAATPDGFNGVWTTLELAEDSACTNVDCEREVLRKLYEALGGDDWNDNTNWLTEEPLGEWYGLTTDSDGRTTGLALPENNLRGAIPAAVGQLVGLTSINLADNAITGSLPAELSNLAALTSLDLYINQLSGPLPPELGDLSALWALSIADNDLSGEIPESFLKLSLGEFLWGGNPDLCIPDTMAFAAWVESIDSYYIGGRTCRTDFAELRAALEQLYESTGGENWTNNTNWLTDKPLAEWYGIVRDYDGRITGLVLFENNLSGTIPAAIGQLAGFKLINLANNAITGSLPAELSNLAELTSLQLSNNQLSGPLPPELGDLSALWSLSISDNDLSGEIPESFLKLSLGKFTWRNNSNLCIPDSMAFDAWVASIDSYYLGGRKCRSDLAEIRAALEQLYESTGGEYWTNNANWLSDQPLAEWYGILRDRDGGIAGLELYDNNLSGTIPAAIGQLAGFKEINLADNAITGSLPAELSNLAELTSLQLDNNQLSGPLPPELGDLSALWSLSISDNDLSGKIPQSFLSLALGQFSWGGNPNLCIPDSMAFDTWVASIDSYYYGGRKCRTDLAEIRAALEQFYESTGGENWTENANWLTDQPLGEWYGIVRDHEGQLTSIELPDNNLSGTIPAAIGQLTGFKEINLANNAITGSLPAELSNLAELTSLKLNSNQLSGPLPPELGDLSALWGLRISNNDLSGEIPQSFLSLALGQFSWGGNPNLCIPDSMAFDTWVASIDSYYYGGRKCRTDLAEIRAALEQFYESTGGENWTENANWLTDQPLAEWYGIVRDHDGRIEGIELPGNNLSGTIPTATSQLTGFKVINLGYNAITGSLPAELSNLAELTSLDLTSNQLSGPLPPELGDLSDLWDLSISDNNLSGEIPRSFLNLSLGQFAWAGNPDLCIPGSMAFDAWVASIDSYYNGGRKCRIDLAEIRAALEQLYESTGGENWTNNDNWLTDEPLKDWFGLGRDSNGSISEIDLSANNLSGSIPAAIGQLAGFTSINLTNNAISGTLPAELGNLTELSSLKLSSNQLTGPLPSELGGLSSLSRLRIAYNDLSGEIPASFINLSLSVFDWQGNPNLCLPDSTALSMWVDEIGLYLAGERCNRSDWLAMNALFQSTNGESWKNLDGWPDGELKSRYGIVADDKGRVTSIDLANNALSGSLPQELGYLPHLQSLRLENNPDLQGRLPYSMSKLDNLKSLVYTETSLCEPIEEIIQSWLESVDIHEGTGVACPEIQDRLVLEEIYKAMGGEAWYEQENWLTDAPLQDWQNVTTNGQGQVTELDLYGYNVRSGPIPIEMAALGELTKLTISSFNMQGHPIPEELGRLSKLRELTLILLKVSGPIPEKFGELRELTVLHLGGNDLSGPIPPTIGKLTELRTLRLNYNSLSGPLPEELGNLVQLRSILIVNNGISGALPLSLGNLQQLREIDLSHNELSGQLPREIGTLAELTWLDLSHNHIDGHIPAEIGELASLTSLNVGMNSLSGSLPSSMTELASLERLVLSGNEELEGSLPLAFMDIDSLNNIQAIGTRVCAPADDEVQTWLDGLLGARVATCDVEIQPAYLTQGTQSIDMPIELVAGRDALLRVFPLTEHTGTVNMPDVQADFFIEDELVHSLHMSGGQGFVPQAIDESSLSNSINAIVPGEFIQPTLELVINIDPDGLLDENLEIQRRIPESGRIAPTVHSLEPFKVVFIPIIWEENPDLEVVEVIESMVQQPDTNELLRDTRSLLPLHEIQATAHESVEVSSNHLFDVIKETELIVVLEGGSTYYMGLMSGATQGPLGIAHLSGRLAVSALDASTIAHEFGHNLSMPHTPCGTFGTSAYPYETASTGVWGYDFTTHTLVSPHTNYDFMSYCEPEWVSDYSFEQMFRYRLHKEDSFEPEVLADNPKGTTTSLIIWGGVNAHGEPFLEPSLLAETVPVFPKMPGRHRIKGKDRQGRVLFEFSFGMPKIEHLNGESTFTFALPIQPGWSTELSSLTFSGPGGSTMIERDAEIPIAIVRDHRSGQVRKIVKDPDEAKAVRSQTEPGLYSRGIPEASVWPR